MRVLVSMFTVAVLLAVAVGPALGASADLESSLILPEGTSRDVPQTIWFQGFLADASTGDPVNATYDIIAEMFDAESGGSSVWGVEIHATTPVVDGWFNIELGITAALPDFASPPYYLQLAVNGEPGMKVSWQVTGIRHDPYAEANRIPVEEPKRPSHLGKYLHPEVYGQPRSMAVHRDPGEVAMD